MKYKVTGRVALLSPGLVLALTADQLAGRAHSVQQVPKGHELLHSLQFKEGEVIEVVDGSIGANPNLEVVPDPKAAKAPEAPKKAEA